ncbi:MULTISPECIES: hypothetical protein [Streptomyces]|uniref:hypothetical protein n=1 Tax=Streptomyces TaxID=1883 RepID=UPI00069C1BE5|nr:MULTISPECIES: hypothetical protein [Streptomyces]MYU56452.1 hypothetical protein [Streptomyces sp. SID7805]
MTPPPPPRGPGRPRSENAAVLSPARPALPAPVVLSPALDDVQLTIATEALAHGRWTRVRTLLAETGEDWDLRGHRLTVLARCPGSAAWARDWQLADPESGDAATLLACATVQLAVRGTGSAEAAARECRTAARMVPADPTPWLAELILARRTGTADHRAHAFAEIRARHPDHHHAHHLMTACLAERQRGTPDDPRHEVYDFAARSAERAPADSPLAVLPVIAHAERYRVLAAAGLAPANPAASGHWSTPRARQDLKAAFDWWLEWEGEGHPRGKVDLNFLAHATFHEGSLAEAAALFHRIGPYATPAPWSYTGHDAGAAFRAARDAVFRSG